jgi:intein/homing endonuclease
MPIPKNYNKDFFKTWSSDMAYILGFLYADGGITIGKRNNYYVTLYSLDYELLVNIASSFSSNHAIAKRSVRSGNVYRIQIGSKVWCSDLQALGLDTNKTKRLVIPVIPKLLIGDFIRGYFDGDGNVWMGYIHKDRIHPTLVIQVAFTSGCFEFLKKLQLLLQANGIQGGSLYSSKKQLFTRLSFSSYDALTIYKIMYNGGHKLYLPRKKQVFEKYKKLRS